MRCPVTNLIAAVAGFGFVVLVWALLAVASDLVSEEIRGWFEIMPWAILRMAAMRLDPSERLAIYRDEWLPDLLFITRDADGRPITRLLKATGYSLGHFWSARRQARHIRRAQQRELAAAEAAAARPSQRGMAPKPGEFIHATSSHVHVIDANGKRIVLPRHRISARDLRRAGFASPRWRRISGPNG
jgi:hypothetical protein